jgi:hypothetical protein
MRRIVLGIVLAVVATVPARAAAASAVVEISASPNPASLGQKVVHRVGVGAYAPLDIWVSATGFEQPRLGTLPKGRWTLECCSPQPGEGPEWHYRAIVPPSTYRFGAFARARGWYASIAAVGQSLDAVWVKIA